MKKLILISVFTFLFCLVVPTVLSQTISNEQHTYKFYNQELTNHIYPFIEEYLLNYKKIISISECDTIVNDIQNYFITYFTEKDILFTDSPVVKITKISDDKSQIAYMLEVNIVLYEELAENLLAGLFYGKIFLIYKYNITDMVIVRL